MVEETDDHTWVHIPEESIIAPGIYLYGQCQMVAIPKRFRDISDWANSLDQMIALELILPGHGFPIFGKEELKHFLQRS